MTFIGCSQNRFYRKENVVGDNCHIKFFLLISWIFEASLFSKAEWKHRFFISFIFEKEKEKDAKSSSSSGGSVHAYNNAIL